MEFNTVYNSIVFCVFCLCLMAVDCSNVEVVTLSTLYLPYTYTPSAQYALEEDAAEQMAYDANDYILYSVGHTNVHVIDIRDVTNPKILYHTSYDNVDVTDVELCGGYVYVSCDNQTKRENGFVDVYKTFNKTTGELELVDHIMVGDLPDMILPTSDCKKLVVAIEAEPYVDTINNRLVDAPGGVVIVTFTDDVTRQHSMKTLGFEKFNDRFAELSQSGVRWVYRGNNNDNPFSNDVEPEYITFNYDETKAFICLQENNAIAVVDLQTEVIEDIYGLGYKQWKDYTFDASDRDNGIHMAVWPVKGMYQPDAIKYFKHGDEEFILTVNEGDAKDYPPYFTEETRVKDLTLSDKFESNQTLRDELMKDQNLGRLKVTLLDGHNSSSHGHDMLYAFGGRSFSIRRADNMELVYDSADEIERKTSLLLPNLFNNNVSPSEQATVTFDKRSDDKGPESESVTIADLGCVKLLMISNERPGTIAIYSIDERDPAIKPKFETIIHGVTRTNGTWASLYNDRAVSMLDPEDTRFVPAVDSPNNQPLLLVSGSVSGTISILQVNVNFDCDLSPGTNSATCININIPTLLTVLIMVLSITKLI